MRVVAARFTEGHRAKAALEMLLQKLHPPDVAIAPLASSDKPAAADALLAGRFSDEEARAAIELVERAGGEVVADIDEAWTSSNSAVVKID